MFYFSNQRSLSLLLLFVIFLFTSPCHGLIEELQIDFDDRSLYHISSFAYSRSESNEGHFSLQVSKFMTYVPTDSKLPADDKWRIGFVLIHSQNDEALRVETRTDELNEQSACFHERVVELPDNEINSVKVFSMADRHNWAEAKFNTTDLQSGYHHLYFSNCQSNSHVSYTAKLIQYNTINGENNYVSAGEMSLPICYLLIFVLFACESVAWLSILLKNRLNAKSVHWLMLACVVVKTLSLLFLSLKYHSLKYYGVHDTFYVLFDIFVFFKGLLLIGVIVLLASGWSLIKPFLTERDKNIMLVTLCIQAMCALTLIVLDSEQEGTPGFSEWRDIFHLLDIVSWLLILVPIVLSIRHQREAAKTQIGKEDDRIGRNLSRLRNFRSFYLLVITYVYLTRIIVYLLSSTLPFEWVWTAHFINEVAALGFYGLTGWLFRPQSHNVYLELRQEDIEELETTKADRLATAAEAQL